MSESDSGELENFFRKRVENPNLAFNENDWLKLEARLDQELPVKHTPWIWMRKYWPVTLLLVAIPFTWLYFAADVPITNAPTTHENQEISSIEIQITNTETTASEPTENLKVLASKEQHAGKVNAQQNHIIEPSEGVQSVANLIEPNAGEKAVNNTGYVVSENGTEVLRLSEASALHFLPAICPQSSLTIQGVPQPSKMDLVVSQVKQFNKHFILGIGYGTDFSSVGMHNYTSPGSRWKIDLEYAITSRFQLGTGVILVNNQYYAYGDEYHAPPKYWKNGTVAYEAFGECKMVDIPVNLRYNFLVAGRHRAFISGGVSTYFLTKEDYYFEYYKEDPVLPHHWGTDKTSIYPFSIINFSAGYEYLFKSRTAVQIEPYIKIPTAGVGWGEVDLYTIGFYLAYRYRVGK